MDCFSFYVILCAIYFECQWEPRSLAPLQHASISSSSCSQFWPAGSAIGAVYCKRQCGCPVRPQTKRWYSTSALARSDGGCLLLAQYACRDNGSDSNSSVETGERAAKLPDAKRISRQRPNSSKLERTWLLSRTTGDLVRGVNCGGAACDEEKRETARAEICQVAGYWSCASQIKARSGKREYHERRIMNGVVRNVSQSLMDASNQRDRHSIQQRESTCHCALCIKSQSLMQSLMYATSYVAASHCFFR